MAEQFSFDIFAYLTQKSKGSKIQGKKEVIEKEFVGQEGKSNQEVKANTENHARQQDERNFRNSEG
jgi:hypothetical protein